MFRRQLFYGITLILLVVIIFLLLRGRSAEKERAAQNINIEQIALEQPSPVRAVLPRDLEIVDSQVSWTRNSNEKNASEAHHDITIHNISKGSYVSLWLRMDYIDEAGRLVENRTHEVNKALPSGATLRLSDITIEGLSDTVSGFRVTILSADLENYQN